MKKSLLTVIICVLAMFGTLKAQDTEVVIDGTVGSYSESMSRFAPIFSTVQYSISQQYYTADEIGMEEGSIKSLSFKTDMMWYEENPRWIEVYMVNTDNSTFNGLSMEQVKSEDLVFSGNVKFAPSSWVAIEFDKAFNYAGGNVLVCVNDLSGQALCPYDSWFTSFVVPEEDGTRCIWSSDEFMPFDPTAGVVEAKEKVAAVSFVKFAFGEVGDEPEQPGDEPEDDATAVVVDGTVGSYSESMNRFAPIFVVSQYSISQQYYTAEEIGMEGGFVKSLSFKTDMWYEENPRWIEVYMVNTENSTFNGLNMEQVKSEDLVFSGNVKFTANSWVTIDFDKYFKYAGGNVLVCVNDLSGQMCYYDSYFTSFVVPAEDGTRCVWSSDEFMPFDPTAKAIEAKDKVAAVPFAKFAFTDEDAIEEMTTSSFNVYPNPANDRLYIETQTLTQTLTVEIYDIYGRIQNLSNSATQQLSNSIDVANLKSGVYFVKVVTENGEAVQRFIKK